MPSTARDRTQEFFATVDSFQTINTYHSSPIQSISKKINVIPTNSVKESNLLQKIAVSISWNIDTVQHRITELEKYSKQTTNFNDFRPKINYLICTIQKNINELNNNLLLLKSSLNKSFNQLSSNHSCIKHYKSLLDILQIRCNNLTQLFNKTHKISIKCIKKQKKEKFKIHNNSYNTLQRSNQRPRPLIRYNKNRGFDIESQLRSKQVQLYQESDYNNQRVIESQYIAKQLIEVSEWISKLGVMVYDQRRTILDIDNNIGIANEHIDGVIEQLQKYLAGLSGNRWLMIKVFGVLIFLAIVFTVFIA